MCSLKARFYAERFKNSEASESALPTLSTAGKAERVTARLGFQGFPVFT